MKKHILTIDCILVVGTLKKHIKINDEYFDEFVMELVL